MEGSCSRRVMAVLSTVSKGLSAFVVLHDERLKTALAIGILGDIQLPKQPEAPLHHSLLVLAGVAPLTGVGEVAEAVSTAALDGDDVL